MTSASTSTSTSTTGSRDAGATPAGPRPVLYVVTGPRGEPLPWDGRSGSSGVACAAVRNRADRKATLGAVAHDVLTFLGHDGHRTNDAFADLALAALPTYLRAHRVSDLVLYGAERLPADAVADFCADVATLVAPTHVQRVWVHLEAPWEAADVESATLTPTPALSSGETGQPLQVLSVERAHHLWREHRPSTSISPSTGDDLDVGCLATWCQRPGQRPDHASSVPAGSSGAAFPPVPSDEALTFLAAVDELLDPTVAGHVRAVTHAAAFRASRDCVPYLPTGPRHQPGIYPLPWVVHYLRAQLEATGDVNEAVTVARGTQLALFHAGWWLTLDVDDFVDAYLATPPPDPSGRDWDKLAVFRTPFTAAIPALAAAGVTRSGLEAVTVRHVADDYGWVAERWRRHTIPGPARFFVHAHIEWLRLHHRTSSDGPFSDLRLASLISDDGQLVPATSGQVAAALAAPHKLLHLTLHGRPRAWAPREEEAWARRWRVGLHPISGATRTASKTPGPWSKR